MITHLAIRGLITVAGSYFGVVNNVGVLVYQIVGLELEFGYLTGIDEFCIAHYHQYVYFLKCKVVPNGLCYGPISASWLIAVTINQPIFDLNDEL